MESSIENQQIKTIEQEFQLKETVLVVKVILYEERN